MSVLNTLRRRLYGAYLLELEQCRDEPRENIPESQIDEWFQEYLDDLWCLWQDIRCGDSLAGFLIIGRGGANCHPDADTAICEAYISPEYRHKGLMRNAVASYVQSHSGTYCLIVLPENRYAKAFWPKLFADLGYEQISLDDCYLCSVEGCASVELFGFVPKSSDKRAAMSDADR